MFAYNKITDRELISCSSNRLGKGRQSEILILSCFQLILYFNAISLVLTYRTFYYSWFFHISRFPLFKVNTYKVFSHNKEH